MNTLFKGTPKNLENISFVISEVATVISACKPGSPRNNRSSLCPTPCHILTSVWAFDDPAKEPPCVLKMYLLVKECILKDIPDRFIFMIFGSNKASEYGLNCSVTAK